MKIVDLSYECKEEIVKHNNEIIKVKQYLSTEMKTKTIKDIGVYCFEKEIYDKPIIDAVFNALLAINYTDLEVEYNNANDLIKIFDYLEVNGIMAKIINAIPKIEYNSLISYFKSTIEDSNKE